MREEVSNGRARRAGGLIQLEGTFLYGHQRCESDEELADRGDPEAPSEVTGGAACPLAVGDAGGDHFSGPPRNERTQVVDAHRPVLITSALGSTSFLPSGLTSIDAAANAGVRPGATPLIEGGGANCPRAR